MLRLRDGRLSYEMPVYQIYLNRRRESRKIIAVSCPLCAIMLEDAVKSEGVADILKVMEISEIINDRLM
jgi:Fe-S oxidoreductase